MGLDNPLHIAFLVVILLLVFGAKRLPEIGRSLGSGMREFKQSITGESTAQQPQQPALDAGPHQAPVQNAQQAAPAQAPPVAEPAAVGQPAGEQPTEQQRA
jgi:sec-independent protein translocase protein TatA